MYQFGLNKIFVEYKTELNLKTVFSFPIQLSINTTNNYKNYKNIQKYTKMPVCSHIVIND